MDKEIKKILKKIESNGYEAYIVGGYVRDYILHNPTTDVDICTNALPKDILRIFDIKKENPSYGSIKIATKKFNYDITTYRREENYKNRKPETITYVNNLIDDIKRRDFTINALCMNSDGVIIDLLDGTRDLENRIIRVIGDTKQKLTEDPLRILRAIRFSIVLDFELDKEIKDFISNNRSIIKTLSYTRKKEELEKILVSKKAEEGLKYLKNNHFCDELEIKYDRIVPIKDLLGMWAQMEFSDKYPFTKSNIKTIKDIRTILNQRVINNETLFNYELYTVLVSAEIMGVTKKEVYKINNSLKIYSKSELKIRQEDVIKILDIEPSCRVKVIYNDVLIKVVNNVLPNNYKKIKDYILKNWSD